MTTPVPGFAQSTPYGRRGPYWSCDPDYAGHGIHTGADYAAPAGTPVVAARPGTVTYSDHGASFGDHQIDLIAGDGTRDFYAHMRSRAVANGARVKAGDRIGEVGSEGNSTGPHLHFERHATEHGGWSCSVVRDPAPSIDYTDTDDTGRGDEMPEWIRARRTTPVNLKGNDWTAIEWNKIPNDEEGVMTPGEAAVRIGGFRFLATVTISVDGADGEVIRTRWEERHTDDRGDVVTDETYPAVEHVVTSGVTYLTDTRVQRVGSGRRLVAQVCAPSPATLTAAELDLFYFT